MRRDVIIKKLRRNLPSFIKNTYKSFIRNHSETIEFLYSIIDFEKLSNEKKVDFEKNYEIFKNIQKNKNKIPLKELHKILKEFHDKLISLETSCYKLCQNESLRKYQIDSVNYCNEICNFLNNNNLNYFITSGTLIGLLRHNGFIPWDDDIDIGMMRKDYESLKKILKENFIEIDIKNLSEIKRNKNKIVDKALRKNPNKIHFLITHLYIQIIKGTCIQDCLILDIFPHDFYKNEYSTKEHQNYISNFRNKIDSISNWRKKLDYLTSEFQKNTNIAQASDKIFYGIDSLDSHLFMISDFIPKDVIFPLRKIIFEGKEFYAPNKMEKYIEFQYKNWKNFPSKIEIAPDLTTRLNYKSRHFL